MPDPAAQLTVTQLTRRIKSLVENEPGLRGVWVDGELSNVRLAGSGHLYFTLKDATAQLRCAYFSYSRGRRQAPPDGSRAQVHGDVRIYERNGEYQLIADQVLLGGTGDLAAQFEALKQKLEAEGLFDPAHKKPLPQVPQRIGIVTSPTTAAFQDVLNVLRRRAPYLSVVLFPATVQGDCAAGEIIAALRATDACPGVEAVLLCRGGGSLEDLWCFNDEALARAIAAMQRPVVCGVGHEIDFTIADFAADLRAPTPSAAAELIAPDAADLTAAVDRWSSRLARDGGRSVGDARERLERTFDRRVLRDVLGFIASETQTVDALGLSLAEMAADAVGLSSTEPGAHAPLQRLAAPLARALEHYGHWLPRQTADLLRSGRAALAAQDAALRSLDTHLQALDPSRPKQQGWALVWQDGQLVRDADSVPAGAELHVEVQRGEFGARKV